MTEHALVLLPTAAEVDEALACIAWPVEGRALRPKPAEAAKSHDRAQRWAEQEAQWDRDAHAAERWSRAGLDVYEIKGYQRVQVLRIDPADARPMSVRQLMNIYHLGPAMAERLHSVLRS